MLEDVFVERQVRSSALMFCIRKIQGPNLEIGYPDIVRGFTQLLQKNVRIVHKNKPQPPPAKSFPLYRPTIIYHSTLHSMRY